MGKKCIPGVICVENMTLFLVIIIGIMVVYLYYAQFVKPGFSRDRESDERKRHSEYQPTIILSALHAPTLDDPYIPPEKHDAIMKPPIGRGLPVNVKTSSANLPYGQVGILTKNNHETMILPLMGRNLWNGRDKWQYYTMSNTAGAINTKLPISVNGRSCTGEYGCDSISNGDIVYVEGYNDTFRATIYENSVLQYLPF